MPDDEPLIPDGWKAVFEAEARRQYEATQRMRQVIEQQEAPEDVEKKCRIHGYNHAHTRDCGGSAGS